MKPGSVVLVTVPPAYKHNHYRFLLVARQVPISTGSDLSSHRKMLETELLDPKTAITAAVKLEAIGPDAVPSLKLGLQAESPWVKFAAAESLAYLGRTEGAEVLGTLAERHAGLRFHCLKALAALDDAASTAKLAELLAHPDSQLRYGAFAALRIADTQNDAIRSERVKDKVFHLHRVAVNSPGLIHISTAGRAEIVAFGESTKLMGGFTLPIARLNCRPDMVTVLQTLAELGAGYADAIEFVTRADRAKVLTASVMTDATPPGLPTQELARLARIDPLLDKTDGEALRVGASQFDVSLIPLDLPKESEAIKAQGDDKPALNRTPGRLFGPRKSDDTDVPASALPGAAGN
jgi:hypothetical protein